MAKYLLKRVLQAIGVVFCISLITFLDVYKRQVLGITCNTLSDLGVGAFSTLPYAVSFLTFLTFGQANIVFYLIFVCIQMILERKISMKFILEIPFSFIFGFLVDLYQYIRCV